MSHGSHMVQQWPQYSHLIVPEPDTAVYARKAEDMIEEGFAALMALGRCEGMREHLLQQLQVRLLVKGLHRKGWAINPARSYANTCACSFGTSN